MYTGQSRQENQIITRLRTAQWFINNLAPRKQCMVYLCGCEKEVLPEGQSEDVQVFPAVAERGQHVRKDLPVLEVVGIDQHDAILKICKHTMSACAKPLVSLRKLRESGSIRTTPSWNWANKQVSTSYVKICCFCLINVAGWKFVHQEIVRLTEAHTYVSWETYPD